MNNLISRNLYQKNKVTGFLLLIILLSGVALRIFHYLYNRSLWMDEVYLCAGLFHMNYIELATRVLDYQQKAPIGFLWTVKFMINLWGENERVLRFIPLLSGIISLFLYNSVCSYFLKPWGRIVALSIFAFAPALVYHSVEIKQYSTECLATVTALYLFILYRDNHTWKAKILWGIYGGIILWFSFSSIFILAGIATGISLYYSLKKEWKLLLINAIPFFIWLTSFIVNYIFFTRKHAESEWIVYFFKVYDNFMPFPPHNLQQLKWFPRNFIEMMDYPLGLPFPVIPAILLFTGIFSLFRINKRNFYVLVFPVLFMLLASGLYLYPLLERFWVFITPVLILLIGTGIDYYQQKIKRDKLILIFACLVAGGPLIQSLFFVIHPEKFYKHKKSFERESLVYINDHFHNGDAVYNYWNNAPGYTVYRQIYNFKYKAVQGADYRKKSRDLADYNQHLKSDFNKFSGNKRVWVIYNNQFLTDIGDKIDDPKWYYKTRFLPVENLIREINKLGKPIKKFVYSDVTIYLFELKTSH